MSRAMLVVGLIAACAAGVWAQEFPSFGSAEQASPSVQKDLHGKGQELEQQYLVEIKILESREELFGDEGRAVPSAAPDGQSTEARTASSAVAAEDLLRATSTDANSSLTPELVHFQPSPDIWDAGYKHPPGVTLIATPRMVVLANNQCSIEMTTQQSFTYLQPAGQGRFERKQTEPYDLGVWIQLAVEPVAGDDQLVKVPTLEVQVAALDAREPVLGLEDLEVGEPIVGKRSLTTSAKLRLGETRFVSIPTGSKRHASLVMRIKNVESQPNPPQHDPK